MQADVWSSHRGEKYSFECILCGHDKGEIEAAGSWTTAWWHRRDGPTAPTVQPLQPCKGCSYPQATDLAIARCFGWNCVFYIRRETKNYLNNSLTIKQKIRYSKAYSTVCFPRKSISWMPYSIIPTWKLMLNNHNCKQFSFPCVLWKYVNRIKYVQ